MKRKMAKLLFIIGSLPLLSLMVFSCASNQSKYDNNKMNNQKEPNKKTNKENVVITSNNISENIDNKINQTLKEEKTKENKEPKEENNSNTKNKDEPKNEFDETDLYWLRKKYNDEILGLFNGFSSKYITETLNNWWREKNIIDESKENEFKEKIQKLIKDFTIDLSNSKYNASEIEKMMNNAIEELLKLSDEISKIIKEQDTQNNEYLKVIFDDSKNQKLISIYNLIYLKTLKELYDIAFKEQKMNIDQNEWSKKLKENIDKLNSEIKNNENDDLLQMKIMDTLKSMLNGPVVEENN
ncbi:hypothetical protein [Mycoplasma sp. CSL7503-lung]|uniref:hypothetical protein n=1 Tax=Mycoplasma sp. CSL7503-lung TaxID=536372 RepID=UPI0021D06EDA|nr:hypothetical protein [Mycoplasma sp. CSL7503-lung]MCU4706340.1 hypothetical protein [Mycoplasma sp. CSL7503-lung]